MIFRNLSIVAGAAALAAMPIAAQAQDASGQRTSASVAEESQLGGHPIYPLFIIIAIAGAGMLALLLTDDDDEDIPMSP